MAELRVPNCRHCQHQLCTKRVPIFSTLGDDELSQLVSLIIHRTYAKGETILTEGENGQGLTIVNHGSVKAFRSSAEGKEQILYIFSAGDFFGEMNLLREQEARYSVEALEPVGVCVVHRDDFRQLVREYPEIGLKAMEELSQRLDRMETMVQNLSSADIEVRVGMMLLEFARKYGQDTPQGRLVNLPLSREGMASYIGVARETVSRKLGQMQDEGMIGLVGTRKVLILDEKALLGSLD